MRSSDVIRHDSVNEAWPVDRPVGVVVTSPPFFGKVPYGDDDAEIGMGQRLSEFLGALGRFMDRAWEATTDDAVVWVNLGDTGSGSGGAGGDHNKGGRKDDRKKYRQGKSGLADFQYCNVVGRAISLLQGPMAGDPLLAAVELLRGMRGTFGVDDDAIDAVLAGADALYPQHAWRLRSEIVWDKSPVVRPEAQEHTARPYESHEKILMFSKGREYKPRWNPAAMEERNNVWHFAPERSSPKWRSGPMAGEDHPAPFPLELPLRCLAASSRPGDLVCDPFHGSGTTDRAAGMLGLDYVGFDLYV